MAKLTLEDYCRQAEMGNPQALFDLACLYYWGRGVSKDVETAIALLRRLEMNAREWAQWARFNIAKMKYLNVCISEIIPNQIATQDLGLRII